MTEKSFVELYESELLCPKVYPGILIKGKVIDIGNRFVVVSSFLKADGYIPIDQFKNDSGTIEIDIGSEVEVVVDYLEDIYGDVKLSREKAKKIRAWENLERIHKANEVIVGIISSKVKGGFTVNINDIKAFLPGSLVHKSVSEADDISGKEFKFKIIKLEKKKNNIVLSQRSIENDKDNDFKEFLNKLKEGDIVSGLVKNITDYGVFIDLGKMDGLLHITDMSWRRIKHPSDLVKIGDKIDVKVLKFDKQSNRVSLGLKQLTEDPWKDVKKKYNEGDHVSGKVTNITDYGCFVEIDNGIEGLVHLSEMDWTNKNVSPHKVVKQGMEVKVSILEINEEKRRISLGLKQCTDNPWNLFEKNNNVNDKIIGKIKSITDFGVFVGLEGGIDGLIHLSDLSWSSNGDDIIRNYKKGEEVETVILGIDVERERISLGIKQLSIDPFLDYAKNRAKGSVVDCNFVKRVDKGIIVKLSDNVDGFVKLSDIELSQIDKTGKIKSSSIDLKSNSSFKAKIISIDKKNRNIILVLKSKPIKEEKESTFKTEQKIDKVPKPTLGDLLKDHI